MTKDVFSLEFTRRYVRIGDLRIINGKLELTALGYDDMLPSFMLVDNLEVMKQQGKIINDLLSNLNIRKRKVNVVIPDSLTYSQIIEMPALKEEELMMAIRYQADEFIPLPLEDVYLDLEILRSDPKTNRQLTLIVAAPKKIVSTIYDTLSLCHLNPISLENELSAVGRLLSEHFFQKWGCSLILNLGYAGTSIYLVEPNTGLILANRQLRIGYEHILRDLKVNFNWDDSKAVDALHKIGCSKDGPVNLTSIIFPLLQEIVREIGLFTQMSQQKFNLKVNQILMMNFDSYIMALSPTIQEMTTIPTSSFPIVDILTPNIITQNFAKEMSSFVSVTASILR